MNVDQGKFQTCSRRSNGDVVAGVGVAHDPRAGFVPSTRRMRLPAASLPSQTMTTPACWE